MILASGSASAWAAEGDSFFQDLESAEMVTSAAELGSPGIAPGERNGSTQLATPPVPAPSPSSAANTVAVPQHVDALLETSLQWESATGERTPSGALAPTGWAPEHAAKAKTPSMATALLGGNSTDPEPDAVITPPVAPASQDPLDRPPSGTPAAAPVEPLPPLNAALKAALDKHAARDLRGPGATERRKERDAIAFFYAAHGFSPIWSIDGKPIAAVDSVLSRLARAGDDGLTLAMPPAKGSSDDIVESELALTEAVVAYAREATGSRVDPRNISPLIGHRPKLADPADVLDSLVAAGSTAGDKLQALNPSEPRYVALRDKLAALRAARMPTGVKPVPAGPILHIGMRDPRVPLLRARFHIDPAAANGRDDLRYDSQIATAVAEYQRANDLPPSGALTAATILALSGGPASRLEGPIVTNMEMWRWMPRDLGANRIEVNVPDYIVTVFHDGAAASQHRVVVGKTETPTPLFSNTMKYLIVNPYWNVPQSIIKKEMLPKAGGDLSYLNGRGYSAVWHGGQWVVRQLPGAKNALGRIKFLFPNDYSVYLHDTPSKALFSASKRAFSHGCVRVDQPFAFGESVLNDVAPEGARKRWSEAHLEDLIGEKEHYINLPVALPIHIEYFTASVDETGRLKLRDDIYGYANAVTVALGQDAVSTAAIDRKPKLVAEHVHRKAPDAPAILPIDDDGLDPR